VLSQERKDMEVWHEHITKDMDMFTLLIVGEDFMNERCVCVHVCVNSYLNLIICILDSINFHPKSIYLVSTLGNK
jgi:stress-induced morphogen